MVKENSFFPNPKAVQIKGEFAFCRSTGKGYLVILLQKKNGSIVTSVLQLPLYWAPARHSQ